MILENVYIMQVFSFFTLESKVVNFVSIDVLFF